MTQERRKDTKQSHRQQSGKRASYIISLGHQKEIEFLWLERAGEAVASRWTPLGIASQVTGSRNALLAHERADARKSAHETKRRLLEAPPFERSWND